MRGCTASTVPRRALQRSPMSDLPAVHVFEPNALGHRPLFLAWLLADPPR